MREAHARTGRRPVRLLLGSMSGHPSAGFFWERKYRQVLRSAGFTEMIGWERLFDHNTYKLILSVYVDGFKIGGQKDGMRKAWEAIRGPDRLILDKPTPFGPDLGCEQSRGTITSARGI